MNKPTNTPRVVDRNQTTDAAERYQAVRSVTLVAAVANLALGILKVTVGVVAHSYALVADGLDSFSDLLTDAVVWLGAREGHRAPDSMHPYGHGRMETGATLVVGLVLMLTAVGIGYASVDRIRSPGSQPSVYALWAAVFCIATKELIYFYMIRVARRVQSKLLRANAWHHRTDSISSVVVLVGLAGSAFGFSFLDPVAAVVVALMIGYLGWRTGWGAARELMDVSLEADRVKNIRQTIQGVEGVNDLHMLRTRHAGAHALVDVHVMVDPHITVSEGHRIAERIRDRVIHGVDEVADVLVHIDSEDDRAALLGRHLPLREEMLRIIRQAIADLPAAATVEDIRLHYQRDQITVEMVLPLGDEDRDGDEARRKTAVLTDRVRDLPHVTAVKVYFSAPPKPVTG